MAFSKIIFNGTTLIDLTQDTAEQSDVLYPETFHLASGESAVGSGSGGGSPVLQTKTKSYTPSETAQSEDIVADSGYDGLEKVSISVAAISSNYVGSNVARESSADLLVSGATITAPAGYYTSNASASVASGSASPASTISGTGATVSHNGTTLTLSKVVSNTPSVSAGYISSGTTGNSNVSLSATDANFLASNIKNGVSIFGLTGSYSGGGGGATGVVKGTLTVASNVSSSTNTKITDIATIGFTPKAFLFYRSDRSATNYHVNAASFITLGSSYYVGTRTRYSNNALSTSGNATNWTTQSSGYLYFNSNTVYFRSSSSYILAAGTWNWVAIE